VINAHRINSGEMPRFSPGGQSHFVSRDDPASMCKAVVKLVDDLVNRGPYSLADLQVLSPMHRGPAGVSNLNSAIQERMNPPRAGLPEVKVGAVTYRLGDKVMCLRNNYEKGQFGIFNGNQGIVVDMLSPDDDDVAEDTLEIDFDGELVRYGRGELNELTLAYASTVHKSQGSEYPAVIAVVSLSHYIMLQRNLLYTAVTRAQNLLMLVGQAKAVSIMIANDRVRERYSRLASMLSEGSFR
ncbi:MAG: ATP-dependent DNA helicase, partial [Bacillota bacterium]